MSRPDPKNSPPQGKFLVLGASGKLGCLLQAVWPKADAVLWHSRRDGCCDFQFDLLQDPKTYVRAATGVRAVLCLPGVTPARADGEDLSHNSTLALAAVQGAATAGVARVFLASSAAVYGRADYPLPETAVPTPACAYGHSKRDMEQATLALAQRLGLPVTILRIGNVAGADAILGGWQPGFRLDQFNDGRTPRRSYIGPVTLAKVIARLMRTDDLPSVLNIAAPGSIEMGALLDAAGLPWSGRPANDTTIPMVELDTRQLTRIMPIAANASSAEGMIDEYRRAGCF
ncbi:MAG: SDR family oxidoreductase [Sulfitobacter sp.]